MKLIEFLEKVEQFLDDLDTSGDWTEGEVHGLLKEVRQEITNAETAITIELPGLQVDIQTEFKTNWGYEVTTLGKSHDYQYKDDSFILWAGDEQHERD
jgi:hypothetical protein